MKEDFIVIQYRDTEIDDDIQFPTFKRGSMYKGMKGGKRYTLKELNLD